MVQVQVGYFLALFYSVVSEILLNILMCPPFKSLSYGGPKVSRQFQFHHGNFNFVHGNFNFITAISISPQQFQLRSRQFQFHHGNFNFTTAISTSSRQFQFHHGNFNFVHGNFNFITAISTSFTPISILSQKFFYK